MTILLIAYLGGVLTIFSPCILPVLPFVFARAERRFLSSGLPMLAGMALAFAVIATLAAVGGAWTVRLNQYGRIVALLLLSAFAATLLSDRLAEWLARPFVAMGNSLSQSEAAGSGVLRSGLLGIATGLLWAPCAGPILGLILTGAAISGPSAQTTLLLFAYAAGAATSLAIALLAGGRLFSYLKRSLGIGEWVRRGLGAAVLLGVIAIAFGWDSSVLTRLSLAGTNNLEQTLIDKFNPRAVIAAAPSMAMSNTSMAMQDPAGASMAMSAPHAAAELPIEGQVPSFAGATLWLNSAPLTAESLHGKVVVVDFWTYSCINCLRALPYVKAWYAKYKDHGLVVVGVHAPEFAFEKDPGNVRRAVKDLGITYPVALDDDYAIWQAFNNQYWPAHYFIDSEGRIRSHHFGEGDYEASEQTIRRLLTAAGQADLPPAGLQDVKAAGIQVAADEAHDQSPETYVGYRRAANFVSPGGFLDDQEHEYSLPGELRLNQWALAGSWLVSGEKGVVRTAHDKLAFRFLARDLHLVLGPGPGGRPVRFRVLLDGAPPGTSHGVDVDAAGNGTAGAQRLYQLIRQSGTVAEHLFTIEFLDAGAEAYSFTFG